jgi:hypothetical protein
MDGSENSRLKRASTQGIVVSDRELLPPPEIYHSSHTYLYFGAATAILQDVISIQETYQAISAYVSSSTLAFTGLTALVGSIWGFVMVARKLAAAFSKKNLFVDFCRSRVSYT